MKVLAETIIASSGVTCGGSLVDDDAFKASNPGNDTGAIAGLYDSEQRP